MGIDALNYELIHYMHWLDNRLLGDEFQNFINDVKCMFDKHYFCSSCPPLEEIKNFITAAFKLAEKIEDGEITFYINYYNNYGDEERLEGLVYEIGKDRSEVYKYLQRIDGCFDRIIQIKNN